VLAPDETDTPPNELADPVDVNGGSSTAPALIATTTTSTVAPPAAASSAAIAGTAGTGATTTSASSTAAAAAAAATTEAAEGGAGGIGGESTTAAMLFRSKTALMLRHESYDTLQLGWAEDAALEQELQRRAAAELQQQQVSVSECVSERVSE
jgi:hypothetical protein